VRVGVIGLGNIGGAIAANLLSDGHEVALLDRDPARMAGPGLERGTRAHSPAELARQAEIAFLSLPTPDAVDAVAGAWLEGAGRGSLLVDLSTNAPARVRALGRRVAERGSDLLEAPLTGGAPGARSRTLVFLCGGDAAAFERARPLLEKLGRAVFHFGPLGFGNTAKLANSLLAFASTWVSLEALAIAARSGLDLRRLVDAVRTGGASNFFVDRMVEGLGARGRPANFALELAAKDAGLVVDLAREVGVPAPVARAVESVLAAAAAGGLGARDFGDLDQWMERQAGCELRLLPRGGESATAKRRVPIEPGYFTIPEDPGEAPRLLGSRCRACGERFFPRRMVCARCLAQDTEDVLLGPGGTLHTWTYVHFPLFGSKRADPGGYAVGQVDLAEGPRVQAVLAGGPGEFRIGMPMRLDLEALREGPEGEEVVIFRFRPAGPAAEAA
jgi:3-hydroxyisobutyrate dehydrogenase-like beta-hydroxyacid dehydrogenase/uncharacterized OB-fold protein